MTSRRFVPVTIVLAGAVLVWGASVSVVVSGSRAAAVRTDQGSQIWGGQMCGDQNGDTAFVCTQTYTKQCEGTQTATCQHCGGDCPNQFVLAPDTQGSLQEDVKVVTKNCPAFVPNDLDCDPNGGTGQECECKAGPPSGDGTPSCGSYQAFNQCPS